jgi:hypothetical protein
MANKRYLPRLRRRLRLLWDATGPAFTQDLSPGGFALELLRVPPPGTTVHGVLPFAGHEFPFTGVVVWARAGEPRINLRGRIGVRFTGIDNGYFTAYAAASGAAPT